MRRRTSTSSFNLAFLDIMFCGFGAVVLLVLIINANAVRSRKVQHEDRRAEVMRLELEVKAGQEYLVVLKNSFQETDEKIIQARGRSREILAMMIKIKEELADRRNQTLATKTHVNKLQSDLKTLDQENRRLGAEQQEDLAQGKKVRRFEGEGNRQYLTGLKLGGKRVLVLVDSSASMLDETIVDIIRRRNMDDETKRRSPKWQQAVKTVEWLVANLPPETSIQMYSFNTSPASLYPEQPGQWIPVTDQAAVSTMMGSLRKTVPGNGTSLENSFKLARNLLPRPDNILLLTDGLPTQGSKKPFGNTVSAQKRIKLFERAAKILPSNIPVNTILFPMEGDPMAAVLFWKLAIDSGGSFLTPTRDWP